MNVMRITDGKVMQKECYTEQYGTRQCMLAVRENLMQKCHVKLDEPVIEQVLRFKKADISQRIQDVIVDSATVYTQGIMRKLREHEFNPEIMRLYVVGGKVGIPLGFQVSGKARNRRRSNWKFERGAVGCLIKNFGEYDPDRVTFNEDIHATAIGYEAWARHDLATKAKAGGQA